MSEIRVNKLINEAGTGSVELTQGATLPSGKTISGSGTIAVNSSGTAAGLTGTPDISVGDITASGNVSIGGTLTYEDVTNVDSIGIITARSHVSIADSIIHTGDTDTSIRFPAANTFAVETGGSERLRVDSSGRTLINTPTSIQSDDTTQGYTPALQVVHRASNAGTNGISLSRFQASNPNGTPFIFQKSKNDTIGSHTIVADDDQIGLVEFAGSDGSDFRTAASISGEIDGTPGTNDMPGRLEFATTADGSATPTERLRITSAGAAIFKGGLAEKYENAGTTLGSQPNNPLSDGNVILFTGNESGNKTINFTGVHATLSNGETVSFTAIITPNNSGKITVAQVDGQAITIKWSGGSAPSAGSSGQDIYTFQILKTGTGVSDYTIFGAATNYA